MAGHPLTTARRHRLGGLLFAALIGLGVTAATVFSVADDAHGSDRAHMASGDEFSYVVHRVEAADVLADPEVPEFNVSADGRFVIVKLSVTNVTDTAQTFQSTHATVSDGVTEYGVDDTAWRYVGQPVKEVPPGASIDAAVVFDVPRTFDVESIVLRDGPPNERVTVPLTAPV